MKRITRSHGSVGAQTVGRKISLAKDAWANYFLGDRRLGDKLGRYGDSKSDGWRHFSDGWAKCVKEEKLKTSDTIIRQMCAREIRDETVCATLRNTGRKLRFWLGKILTLTLRPLGNQYLSKHAIWHKKRCRPS